MQILELILQYWNGYWLAAAAGLALGLQALLPGSSRLLLRQRLALAAAASAWGGYHALVSGGLLTASPALAWSGEFALLLAWFAFLYRLLRGPYRQSMPELVRRLSYLFWTLLFAAALAAAWAAASGAWALPGMLPALLLAATLAGLGFAAQLHRDAPVEDQPALRGFVAGSLLHGFVQLLWFGQMLLAPPVPAVAGSWRGAAVALALTLIVLAMRRHPQWSLAIFVSPQARAYAPRLAGMASLLAIYAVSAPLLRGLPVADARLLALLLLLGTALPVIGLLLSDRLSAQIKVFISKHFLPFRYDYREEWLRLIDTLASPVQRLPLPERTIKAVAQIVGSPAGVLWLRRSESEPFVCAAHWNTRIWPDTVVPADDPVLEFMRERQWILDTAELQRDPAMYPGLRRPAWLERFPDALLVVPLINNEMLLGFMVLFQSSSAFRLTYEEIDLLRTSGRQVAAYLAQYQADQQLAESQQFEAFNRLTAFVMHDLKNLIAQQSLVVKNASRHKNNPAFFEDAIATIDNSVARMSRLLKQLQSGTGNGDARRVSLVAALEEAVERVGDRRPAPELELETDGLEVIVDRERLVSIVTHLLRNAQDATPVDGRIRLCLAARDGLAEIAIEDSGCGMEPEFVRTRLFRPFDTTKGSQGMGIGAYQVRTFAQEAGGRLDVWSEPGRGSRFTLCLPLAEPAAEAAARAAS